MSENASHPQLKPEVLNELRTLMSRVRPSGSAERLWDRVLTEQERQQLGGKLEDIYPRLGTAGIWKKLRGVSDMRALIEVGKAIGFLNDPTSQWLLREVGEEPEQNVEPDRPSWHPETGELCWGASPTLPSAPVQADVPSAAKRSGPTICCRAPLSKSLTRHDTSCTLTV